MASARWKIDLCIPQLALNNRGVAGGMAGAFAGYHARKRSAKALGIPDIYVALVEDLICVTGSLWIVTRFQ